MNRCVIFLFAVVTFMLLASCARNKGLVVLLPQPDGKAGQVVVSNAGGTQVLTEAGQGVAVPDAERAPLSPVAMDDVKIREDFGEALAALPPPPIHFILYFRTDTTELTEESRKVLAQVLPAVVERKSTDVSVVGHTDTVGTREYNCNLGMERALLLKNILVSLGINPAFIEVASHGEGNLLVKTGDEVDEPRNRRVEVVVR
jgi:outer membrane protein OmpA-like peptidoglycan-associated protein